MAHALKPLEQQVIVVTGASSGIGLATVALATQRRARLVLAARSRDTLARIRSQIEANGGEAEDVECDVADRKQVDRLAQAAISRFGAIDTWINNAGGSIYGKLWEVSEADNRRLFDTNFWGVVNGSLAALPYLIRQGGALINVGSEVSEAVIPLQGMYAASKHAVKGFTDALRVELELEDVPVSVTLIQPTAVDTPFPQHAKNYMDREPKLPTPMIDPLRVAEAILDAAGSPAHNVKVGSMAKLNTTMFNFAPAIAEWMAGKQADRQQHEAAPRNPEGALHRAGDTGRIYGSGAPGQRGRG